MVRKTLSEKVIKYEKQLVEMGVRAQVIDLFLELLFENTQASEYLNKMKLVYNFIKNETDIDVIVEKIEETFPEK